MGHCRSEESVGLRSSNKFYKFTLDVFNVMKK